MHGVDLFRVPCPLPLMAQTVERLAAVVVELAAAAAAATNRSDSNNRRRRNDHILGHDQDHIHPPMMVDREHVKSQIDIVRLDRRPAAVVVAINTAAAVMRKRNRPEIIHDHRQLHRIRSIQRNGKFGEKIFPPTIYKFIFYRNDRKSPTREKSDYYSNGGDRVSSKDRDRNRDTRGGGSSKDRGRERDRSKHDRYTSSRTSGGGGGGGGSGGHRSTKHRERSRDRKR